MYISKIESVDGYNCLDNLIISILNEAKMNYELMSLYSWDFKYHHITNSPNQSIGNRLDTSYNSNYSLLEKYHGLKVDFYDNKDAQSFFEELPLVLKKNDFIIIEINPFWCAWMKSHYKLINSSHFCMVSEIKANGDLIILDSENARNKAILSHSDFINGFQKHILVNFTNITKNINNDWRDLLFLSIQNIYDLNQNINKFDDIITLSSDIHKCVDFESEITTFNLHPFKSEIFQKIHQIGQQRKRYGNSIKYIANCTNIEKLLNASKIATDIGHEWSSIFGMLCKLYVLGNPKKLQNRISDKIRELAFKEKKLYSELFNLCTTDSICTSYVPPTKPTNCYINGSNYYLVDISYHFNNNGTSNSLVTKSALSYGNRFLYLKETGTSSIEINGMKFNYPNISSLSDDNVSCEEQVVNLNISAKKYIMFLGCSELGNHVDTVKLIYEDESYVNYPLKLTNWLNTSPNYDDIAAVSGQAFETVNNKARELPKKGFLYAIKFPIDNSQKVKSIQLPYCPNIHVFAISFCD